MPSDRQPAQLRPRLLIMDDEPGICSVIERIAGPLGFDTRSLTDPKQFVETVAEFTPSLLILDLKMPGYDGVQLLQRLKDVRCEVAVIVMSGMDQRVLSTAAKLGQVHGLRMLGVLQKPIQRADLEAMLSQVPIPAATFAHADLEAAIANRELVVHYQPKLARQNGRWSAHGSEALVRWRHPSRGLVMPEEFLAQAEDSDLVELVTDHVLEICVEQVSRWMHQGLDLSVAVNLSARLVEDLEFPDRVRHVLAKHGVPGSKLTLELTESAAMSDPAKAMDILLRLRVNDIGLAIDDFGAGYSSLKQLHQLPFDELKIDKSFVGGLPGDDDARTIVRATIDMAHALGMTVCAEGVETIAALNYLESVHCDAAQGFLISPAVPADELERVIDGWNGRADGTTGQ